MRQSAGGDQQRDRGMCPVLDRILLAALRNPSLYHVSPVSCLAISCYRSSSPSRLEQPSPILLLPFFSCTEPSSAFCICTLAIVSALYGRIVPCAFSAHSTPTLTRDRRAGHLDSDVLSRIWSVAFLIGYPATCPWYLPSSNQGLRDREHRLVRC